MIHYYNISWIYLKGCSILISVYISLLAFNFFYPIETSENIIDKIPEIPYHKRYPLVKQDGEISDEKAKEFKNNVIFEHTPNGYIFMKYNSDENAFEFYSDPSRGSLPLFRNSRSKILQTISLFFFICCYGR